MSYRLSPSDSIWPEPVNKERTFQPLDLPPETAHCRHEGKGVWVGLGYTDSWGQCLLKDKPAAEHILL